jgi:hypothetical protein
VRKLSIFDDGALVATISTIDNLVFIFARSSREWSEMKRLSSQFNKLDKNYLEQIANRAHDYNFNTELVNE